MARFPKKETEIAALAEPLWRGLLDNNAVFPAPPVHPILVRIRKLIYQSRHNSFMAARSAAESEQTSEPATIKQMEIILIKQALKRNKGNKTAAAKQLGIDKSTLFRKMKVFDIKPEIYSEQVVLEAINKMLLRFCLDRL